MGPLVFALAFFFAVHAVPFFPNLRGRLVARAGERVYRGAFSLLSIVAFVMIIRAYGRAEFVELWTAPAFARGLTYAVMPVVFVLLVAAYTPTHIRKLVRHPMALAVLLWGLVHLAATGDAASVLVFGSFAAYAALSVVSAEARGKLAAFTPKGAFDAAAVATGLAAYGFALYFHGALFGPSLV
ncbi:MAG TPA: NnrU family protein [Sphingomonadales bacterium]|nr:NnrU family protein [Sphingomonadales bacterium]